MKQFYTAVLLMVTALTATAQNINIPDALFKAKLLASSTSSNIARNQQYQNIKIDANNDGVIQQSEALAVYHLKVGNINSSNPNDITSFEGLQHFTNLVTFEGRYHAITAFTTYLPNIEELNIIGNNISSLDVTGLQTLKTLACSNNNISELLLTGLTNLTTLSCSQNPLGTLNISGLTALESLSCSNNGLTTLDLSTNPNLLVLDCRYNSLTTLDVTPTPIMSTLYCGGNNITVLDVSGLPYLATLDPKPMANLTAILANNNEAGFEIALANGVAELPNLRYICVRQISVPYFNQILAQYGYINCTAGSYCPLATGPNLNTIEGKVRFDSDGNGCTATDALTPNVMLHINDGSNSGYTYTNNQGYYRLPVASGNFTILPVYNNQYYSLTPSSSSVSFTTNFNTHTANFCIGASGTHPDLAVTIIPIVSAMPGFNARYNIVVTNKGDMVQSGSLNFLFDDTKLDYLEATPILTNQATGSLTWSFSNLLPFQTKVYDLTLKVNSPVQTPAVNINDILAFTASITTAQTDITPADNTYQFNQVVIGSYDPNDKRVLQGGTITTAQASGYLDYIIRFQNSGTAEAINVVVKDMLSSNLDPATFVPIAASHPYRATLSATNKLEFIFENINLPAEQDNEPASHGFIAFKVKPKNTVTLGSVIDNTAEIYFDYNAPIITNTVSTTVAALMTGDFEFGSEMILYPIPAEDKLTMSKKGDINITSISVYNMLGQLVLIIPNNNPGRDLQINTASLKAGNYLLEVRSDKGRSAQLFVKN